MSLHKLVFPALFAFAIVFTGCSSTKTEDKGLGDSLTNGDIQAPIASGDGFELNGDSDSGKAGPIKTVYFDFDSAILTGTAKSTLDANIAFLKANSTIAVQVEGHADERGGIQYNLALGENRAQSVRDYMVSMGIPASRVTTISFGKERPFAFGHDESSWSQNRRGTFVITAK